jgi:hypothetical protein
VHMIDAAADCCMHELSVTLIYTPDILYTMQAATLHSSIYLPLLLPPTCAPLGTYI